MSSKIPSEVLEREEPEFCSKINPRDPFTSMIVANSCRLVMGPGRDGEVYGIVALVPDGESRTFPISKYSNADILRTNERGSKCKAIMGR